MSDSLLLQPHPAAAAVAISHYSHPQKDKSCPFVIKSTELTADSYTVEWPIPKNMTKAAWYATVLVQCENGTLNSYCQVSSLLLRLLEVLHCDSAVW
jgi:hypothetical protein